MNTRRLGGPGYHRAGRPSIPSGIEARTAAEVETERHAGAALSEMFGRGLVYTGMYAAQSITAILVTPIIVRALGATGYGRTAEILTIASVLFVLCGLSLQIGLQRLYAEPGGIEACRRLVALICVSGLAVTAVIDQLGRFWSASVGFAHYGGALRLGVWWAGLSGLTLAVVALLRSEDRLGPFMAVMGVTTVGNQILALSLIVVERRTPEDYFLGLLLSQVVGLALAVYYVRPEIPKRNEIRLLWVALCASVPLVPHQLALQVLNLGDRVVVQRELGPVSVARYQLAYNAAAVIMLAGQLVNAAWYARLYQVSDRDILALVLSRARSEFYRLLVPLVMAVILVSPIALRILAPSSLDPNGLFVVVDVVAWSTVPFASFLSNLRVLLVSRVSRPMAWITPTCAAANIGMNIGLVRVAGINGSAIATFIAYLLLGLLSGRVARRYFTLRPTPRSVQVMVAGGMASSALLFWVPDSPSLLVARAVLAIVFLAWFGKLLRGIVRVEDV